MKPTEAKEWIDKLVSTGMNRDAATVLVNEAAALPKEVALCALGMTYGARAAAIPVEPEPPPVEIPRRVVWLRTKSIGTIVGSTTDAGRPAITVNFGGINDFLFIESDPEIVYIDDSGNKPEQARLLLERLSREDDTECDRGDERVRVFHKDGGWGPMPEKLVPHGTPFFKSYTSWSNARTAIIRAGLAWWEEGE